MKSSSNALVIYNNRILLLLRDNKPNIPNPNTWSLLGGEVEEGETFEQALLRELKEEANISVKNFQFLGKMRIAKEIEHAIYVVKLDAKDVRHLELGDEGQSLKFFRIEELENASLPVDLKGYLKLYGEYLKDVLENDKKIDPKLLGFS